MNTVPYQRIVIPRAICDEITRQALSEMPNECCGFLGGRIDSVRVEAEITHFYPLVNVLRSPTRFRADPLELLHIHRRMRAESAELIAIYHSHPSSQPIPSRFDLDGHFHGEKVTCVILGLLEGVPSIRAWRMYPNEFVPVEWEVGN